MQRQNGRIIYTPGVCHHGSTCEEQHGSRQTGEGFFEVRIVWPLAITCAPTNLWVIH